MKKQIKSLISLALSGVMLLTTASAATTSLIKIPTSAELAAAEAEEKVVNVTFNDIFTNSDVIEGTSVYGGKVKVVETTKNNKALMLRDSASVTGVCATGTNPQDKNVVYSVDVMAGNDPVTMYLGAAGSEMEDNSKDSVLVRVKDNVITTHDYKTIGKISSNKLTTISVVVKKKTVMDVYVDYKKVLSNWKVASAPGSVVLVRKLTSTPCYIDNLRQYVGTKPNSNMAAAAFLNDYVDKIAVDDTKGDLTFFDNRYCYTSGAPAYRTATLNPKTNKITTTRLIDYQSPTRTDYIEMERVDANEDCFFDVTTNVQKSFAWANLGSKIYQYFKVEGDFYVEAFNSNFTFAQIRDTETTGAQQNYQVTLKADGSITSSGGGNSGKVVEAKKWFHALVFFNLVDRVCEVYVDGKKVLTSPITNNNIKKIIQIRTCMEKGDPLGKVRIDNFDVTGLDKPIVDGVETRTNVFATDDAIVEFLEGKTALHTYGNNIHKDGVKSHLETKGIYDEETEQYYAPVSTLNKTFDIALTNENGTVGGDIQVAADGTVTKKDGTSFKLQYAPKVKDGKMFVPIRQFAEDALGKYVWFFKTGILIFTDDKPVKLNTEGWDWQSARAVKQVTIWNDIDFLNAYLQYLRPDEDQLLVDIKTTLGDNVLAEHPRIVLDKADFDLHRQHYKAQDDVIFTGMVDTQISTANGYCKENQWQVPYAWDDAMRTLSKISNNLINRFTAWGYAYQITGDQKYVDAAYKLFQMIDTYPDFNTSHIIDTGDDAFALAIGFDWLYDGYTPEQREFVQSVVDKCLQTLASGLYGRLTSNSSGTQYWGAFKGMSNYNSIIDGGVLSASLATLEYNTPQKLTYIKDASRSIEYSMQMLTPHGGWNEAVGYWSYAMRYIGLAGSMLENAFGSSYGLMDGQGMSNTVNYTLACLGVGGVNNYGDCGNGVTTSYNNYFYLGKRTGNDIAVKMRRDDLMKSKGKTGGFYDVMYYDFESVKFDSIDGLFDNYDPLLLTRGTEVVSIRDSYDFEKMQTYFSTHFGTTDGYHQHDDCGTFVLDLMGERWAYDLGSENYNLINELRYNQLDLIRYKAEGHNMLILNPEAHGKEYVTKRGVFVPVARAEANKYGGYVTADMTEVYDEVTKMNMGYYVGDNMQSLTYQSEFTLPTNQTAYWSMWTKADITIDGNMVFLSQNGKSVKIEFLTKNGSNARWIARDGGPLDWSPKVPEQNKNADYNRLLLSYNAGKGENVLAVKISPANLQTDKIEDVAIADWKLPEYKTIKEYNTRFKVVNEIGEIVAGKMPVFDGVMPNLKVIPEDPQAIVEISKAGSIDGITSVKVWDRTHTVYAVSNISYYKASNKNMNMYNIIPITDISVSSTPEPQNNKDNIIDNDITTRWTGMAYGEYAVADIGSVQKIDAVGAAFWKGYERSYYFDVYTSVDGKTWTEAYMKGENTPGVEDIEPFAFDKPHQARYIKIVGNGNSVDSASKVNINLLELKILRSKK